METEAWRASEEASARAQPVAPTPQARSHRRRRLARSMRPTRAPRLLPTGKTRRRPHSRRTLLRTCTAQATRAPRARAQQSPAEKDYEKQLIT